MNLIGKSCLGLAGLTVCMGMAAASANAQQASFTLPVQAHWGKSVLEPGDYKVRFPSAVDPTPVLRVTGNGKTLNFLLQVRSNLGETGQTGKLRLLDVNGNYTVESISSPDNQQAYLFPLPKHHETSSGNNSAQSATKIAVQIKSAAQ